MSAPIINIWCMNKIGKVHDFIFRPCMQVFHDLFVHGQITHQYHKYKKIPLGDRIKNMKKS